MDEAVKTLVTILKHQGLVRAHMGKLAQNLGNHALGHDLSKLGLDEFGGFVAVNRTAREHPYSSEEYKASLKGNAVIDLHFSRNRHHPEFHENGVADMGLLDIIEMVCDWKAASETYGMTSFQDAMQTQVKRFGLTAEQLYLIGLIAKEIE